MRAYKRQHKQEDGELEAVHRLQAVSDTAIRRYMDKLRTQFGKHVVSPEETRRAVDAAMGDKELTAVLDEMRESDRSA